MCESAWYLNVYEVLKVIIVYGHVRNYIVAAHALKIILLLILNHEEFVWGK